MNYILAAASYYVHDHLGNTRVVYSLTCNGTSLEKRIEGLYDYHAFGSILRELYLQPYLEGRNFLVDI